MYKDDVAEPTKSGMGVLGEEAVGAGLDAMVVRVSLKENADQSTWNEPNMISTRMKDFHMDAHGWW
jgi:hypothetical protein